MLVCVCMCVLPYGVTLAEAPSQLLDVWPGLPQTPPALRGPGLIETLLRAPPALAAPADPQQPSTPLWEPGRTGAKSTLCNSHCWSLGP